MIEGISIIIILILCYIIYNKEPEDSSELDNLRDENEFLKLKLNENNTESKGREDNLTKIINELQSSIPKDREDFEKRSDTQSQQIKELQEKLDNETEARKKVLSQKKSGEVRLGHIAETLAPFLDQFEFDPERCSFLGKPIDYISFGDDEITFIEVKSGNAQLNQRQRQIKELVKQKAISWKEVRIK
jgi:predicted Holliday junction resolvase-like endonuclease